MIYSAAKQPTPYGGGKPVSFKKTAATHQSFNAYSIKEDETILFYESYSGNCVQEVPVRNTKDKFSYLLPVLRVSADGATAKKSWLNLGLLSRQMNAEDGSRVDIDEAREILRDLANDEERVNFLAGKSITGVAPVDGFRPEGFEADETGRLRPTGFEAYAFPSFTINDEKWAADAYEIQ